MEWFRWYHGASTDPKFRMIAKRAGCRTSDVVAVWAFMLESASCNAMQRGHHASLDFEEIDLVFDLDAGTAKAVYDQFVSRGLVDCEGGIENWSKRQPKREDATSTERSRKHRATQRNATQRSGTQGDAHKNRAEQSREEDTTHTHTAREADGDPGADLEPRATVTNETPVAPTPLAPRGSTVPDDFEPSSATHATAVGPPRTGKRRSPVGSTSQPRWRRRDEQPRRAHPRAASRPTGPRTQSPR